MIALLMVMLAAPPTPEGPTDQAGAQTFFDAVVGEWRGEGELFGQPTAFEMTWTTELGGRFARLRYSILGDRGMEAVGHYRLHDTEPLTGSWVDSRGEILQLSGEVTEQRLEIIWRSPAETGRTTYELLVDGRLAVVDYYQDGDAWQPFANAHYSRVPSEAEAIPDSQWAMKR